MKVWIVWASNGESYEYNVQDIWAVCSSEEAAIWYIHNAHKQIRHDEERYEELREIEHARELTKAEITELSWIETRSRCAPWGDIPYLSIREYEMIN